MMNELEFGLSGDRSNPILFSVIIAVLSIVAFSLWKSTPTPTRRCRRIKGIPIEKTIEDLKSLLEEHLPEESHESLTLAPSSLAVCMATFKSKKFPTIGLYPVDDGFVGITPISGSEGAAIE